MTPLAQVAIVGTLAGLGYLVWKHVQPAAANAAATAKTLDKSVNQAAAVTDTATSDMAQVQNDAAAAQVAFDAASASINQGNYADAATALVSGVAAYRRADCVGRAKGIPIYGWSVGRHVGPRSYGWASG